MLRYVRTLVALNSVIAVFLFACVADAQAPSPAPIRLLPAPREAHFGQTFNLPAKVVVNVPAHDLQDEFAGRDLEESLKQLPPASDIPRPSGLPYRVSLLRVDSPEAKAVLSRTNLLFDSAMQSEGYVLDIEPRETVIIGASSSGIFYGVQTLKQLLPLSETPRVLAAGTVRDWPAMRYRGIHDDLSRGPFPTLDFQKHQIRVFASFKVNIYSPYFEHTLVYPDHPLAAPNGSSLTPAEVSELVAYARQYHVTIVPEQEAFGHLHHVLKYELYQDLAETPHGYVLAPGQAGSLPLIKEWFTQIAQEFPSPFIHIGADETFELGLGRTKDAVAQQGYGSVYVSFLKQIHDQLAPLNRRLLFWGDIGDANPDAVSSLPKDMIAIPWNYWDSTGFDKMIEPFRKQGIETWVAPGDANWNQVYPIARTAFWNIQGFIRDGQRLGSTGALTTVWNDDGEGLFNMDWYGVLFGAVAAWQPGESSIVAYQEGYGAVFHHDGSGKIDQAEKELMAAHEAITNAKTGLTTDQLFWIDASTAEGQGIAAKLLPQVHDLRMHAERAIELIAAVRPQNTKIAEAEALAAMDLGARRLDLIGMKFQLVQEMASGYARAMAQQHDKAQQTATNTLLEQISSDNGRCEDLRDAYSAMRSEYSEVWLGENRPYWLNNVTVRYDLQMQLWQHRAELVDSAIRGWQNGGELPPASAIGLPSLEPSRSTGS